MKRLAGIIALMLCGVLSQSAMAFEPENTLSVVPGQAVVDEVFMKIHAPEDKIEVSLTPKEILDWLILPGANYQNISLHVKALGDWQISVIDANLITSGYMAEWTGEAYTTKRLENPLKVKADNEVTLSEGGMIQSGTGAEDVLVTIEQTGSWDDEPLEDGGMYRIVLTFTASRTE